MKKIVSILIMLLAVTSAQAQFTQYGKIEFERKVNIKRTLNDLDDDQKQWIEKFKAQIPDYNISYFDLYFNTAKSLYKPGKEVESATKLWFAQSPANDNVVMTDFGSEKVKANKTVFEQKFLVEDSMRKIEWKVYDEIRTIANYKCRKAVGKMFDSVYIVAYYTEDIMVSGGPEMFSGLPGMILQIAIPRMHTTWIAQKIEMVKPKDTDFTTSDKGKKTTQKELYETLKTSFKDWGKYADKNLWWTLL
ncbi:MAG: GLPGLI family protein [Flavipsychrobacter sp.]|nr:GLPGLI family protein [Flavipsychrobacter sp.]